MKALIYLYILGATLAFCYIVFNKAVDWLYSKITGLDVFRENLKKLEMHYDFFTGEMKEYPVTNKEATKLILLEMSLSWISVIIQIWKTFKFFIQAIKEQLTVSPALKELYYPLRNNPYLEKEIVWARLISSSVITTGRQLSLEEVYRGIEIYESRLINFNRDKALKYLLDLEVVKNLKDSA